MNPEAPHRDMALIKEGVKSFAGGEPVKDHSVADAEFLGQLLEMRECCSVSGDVESDLWCSAIGGEAPEQPVEAVPAADPGDAEEVECCLSMWRHVADGGRGDIEAVSDGDMGFVGVAGAGELIY